MAGNTSERSYDKVPPILRDAILAADDKNSLSHSGVDCSVLPRVVHKAAASSLGTWRKGGSVFRLLLPHGGSTLTQELVRGYFLRDLTRRERSGALVRDGLAGWLITVISTRGCAVQAQEHARGAAGPWLIPRG